ncbi:Nuclear transcription factor Y subunit beta AltName: Full=CAAT box DNA-binding protein subunit B; AltName: Full=Nuclear transcription factor Y subunit B; Short=NF-YB [Serendipita indica DSM 11827]|uniref:Probable transcription factor HAP3 n=1 Tax=Serendipita indica (strain DSM 11827) TaxID=1109443 RepID=G4TCD1_SERID|nr:Nuclear transcription factor Y subunit beta AltName: Full=CAAT box DNA-binding protein subunit B; AltName: Full=Nuclear transcription factor Y subunit B; Short=NF-YB [Serendipita indica DSM 11827]CCA68974.1 probable transcription factor HAP3 [Serendipita indica DSM 11827]
MSGSTNNPPLASVDSKAAEPELSSPPTITDQEIGEFREQDRVLPIANIARIMKNSVPMTSKISKEAKEAVQECISEFISFITSEAAEKCHDEKRKTIGGEDVLYAMMLLGLEQYVEPLKIHLAKMRAPSAANGIDAEPQEDEQGDTSMS